MMSNAKLFTPSNILHDFGAEAELTHRCLREIYTVLLRSAAPEVKSAFKIWEKHLSKYTGELSYPTSLYRSLYDYYELPLPGENEFNYIIFALHTYLSLLMRMIIACAFGDIDCGTFRINASDGNAEELKHFCARLESNKYFQSLGIQNYLENDFYGWLHYDWSDSLSKHFLSLWRQISEYDVGHKSNSCIDVIQHLYPSLFPIAVRHKMGEYYTPQWLAEHVLDELQCAPKRKATFLDPACGSGIFLLVALRNMFKSKQGETSFSFDETRKALERITGFDINPLAVQAAKTNILLLLPAGLQKDEPLTVPIYLADALSLQNISPVDFVVGNPPWVFWNNLSSDYRQQIAPLMTDTYALSNGHASTMKRLGAAGKDISMLFFYVAIDKYLREKGRLGFIMPQSVFQSTAGDEFRRFTLPDGSGIAILKVEDWVKMAPFRGTASNKTSVVFAEKGRPTIYPIPYIEYLPISGGHPPDEICPFKKKSYCAYPHDPKVPYSFWVIDTECNRFKTPAEPFHPQVRLGIETKLEAVFRIHLQKEISSEAVLVANNRRRAKIEVPPYSAEIEKELIYPFVSGASLRRWGFTIAGYYLIPHTAETGIKAISLQDLIDGYPKTYAYFQYFKEYLANRSLHKRWGRTQPFYAMYGIGPYTFAPYRVAWKRTTKDFSATVISSVDDDMLGKRPIVANGKVMIIPFQKKEEAHFICGVLNAPVFRERINRCITSEAHRDIINVVPLATYDRQRNRHRDIMRLSLKLHSMDIQSSSQAERIVQYERKLDLLVREEWELKDYRYVALP